ncbi:MAG: helix-turn-helix domain-containing protein [Nitriliruptoraceae bacterium]
MPEQQIYRALSSSVRVRLLEVLRDEPAVGVAALGERLGLHVNTVRTHLNLLEEAGLVEAIVENRDRPGRPKLLYSATADLRTPAPGPGEGGYRFLAEILASYFDATTENPSATAERAGHVWGSFLAAKPAPFRQPDVAGTVTYLLGMLEEFGFAPEVDPNDPTNSKIVLRHCPFLDVAREYQDVVCAVHLGLMRGMLEESRADVHVRDLIPWATPETCVTHLGTPSLRVLPVRLNSRP